MKKKIISCIIIFVGILLIGFGTYFCFFDEDKNIETKIRLEDDFYENINFELLKSKKIPMGENSWSYMGDGIDIVDKRKEELSEEILKDYHNDNLEIFLELYQDYEGRNSRGLSEIQQYFDNINNASNIDEFTIANHKATVDLGLTQDFVAVGLTPDYYDSTKKVVSIVPMTIDSGLSFDMFILPMYKKYADYGVEFRKKLLVQYGYSLEEADSICKEINDFIIDIQSKSINLLEVTDSIEIYKKYTLSELKENIVNLPLFKELEEYGYDKYEDFVVYDIEFYKALDKYYTNEHLNLLKKIAIVNILETFVSQITTNDYLDIFLDYNEKLNSYKISFDEYNELSILGIKTSFIEKELNLKYEEKYFDSAKKEEILNLINEIVSYYKDVINSNEWMNDSTKEQAIAKLDDLKINIGYLESETLDELKCTPKSNGGTLISCFIEQNKKEYAEIENIKVSRNVEYDNLMVNAYYNPLDNSINFPAGIMSIIDDSNEYSMMGSIGTIIAHEISHAFDLTGSKFDENGVMNDWWTEEDKQMFNEKTSKIEDYYSNYSVLGFKIDGKKTLNENIADLGAMNCIISIAENKNATSEDYKTLFESYAKIWASKEKKDFVEQSILFDSHSPNKVRVNAVLSSIDKFYDVYDIKEDDLMYVKKEDRVELW